MQCTNPKCVCNSPYLRDGSLHLLELEASSSPWLELDEVGFPMRSSPQRYFWLCSECTKQFTLTKWTLSGVVLALRKQVTSTRDGTNPQFTDSVVSDPVASASPRVSRWKSP